MGWFPYSSEYLFLLMIILSRSNREYLSFLLCNPPTTWYHIAVDYYYRSVPNLWTPSRSQAPQAFILAPGTLQWVATWFLPRQRLSVCSPHNCNRKLVSNPISLTRGITPHNFFSVERASVWSQGGIVAIFQRATKNWRHRPALCPFARGNGTIWRHWCLFQGHKAYPGSLH